MSLFDLPPTSTINRVVPKNSFDSYSNPKQKRQFSELVEKIRWVNKLSKDTVNLAGQHIQEIQIFEVDLRRKQPIGDLLEVIDRAIPYTIIFSILAEDEIQFVTSVKHLHPGKIDTAVIDWTFYSQWQPFPQSKYRINLARNLDFVFTDFCNQISGMSGPIVMLDELVKKARTVSELKKSIEQHEFALNGSKQFKDKVALNMELQRLQAELNSLV